MRQLNNLYFELTGACNLLCKHCYIFTTEKMRERSDLLTPELIESAVEQAIPLGLHTVTFTGGEIFLRKDIREILERTSKYPIKLCLLTNLTLVTEEHIYWLSKLPIQYIATSIDGFESVHDQFRGKTGAFKKTMDILKKLKSSGIPIKVSVTVGNHNIDHAAELFAYFDSLSIPASIAKIAPIGRGRLIDTSDSVEFDKNYTHLLSERMSRELIHTREKDFGPPGQVLETFCGVGDSMLYIMSNGKIAFCPTLNSAQGNEWVVGDLLSQQLRNIWDSGKIFGEALHCKQIATCGVGKLCRGGCRANAFARTGDISACDTEIYNGIMGWMSSRSQNTNEIIYPIT